MLRYADKPCFAILPSKGCLRVRAFSSLQSSRNTPCHRRRLLASLLKSVTAPRHSRVRASYKLNNRNRSCKPRWCHFMFKPNTSKSSHSAKTRTLHRALIVLSSHMTSRMATNEETSRPLPVQRFIQIGPSHFSSLPNPARNTRSTAPTCVTLSGLTMSQRVRKNK